MAHVDFYFDLTCPYAYLAHTQIDALVAKTKVEVRWKPFLLGGVFQAIGTPGGPMVKMGPAKARINEVDLARWADALGQPLVKPPTHPNRSVLALRALLASGDTPRAARALFAAYWARGRDISQPEVVREALDSAGFDGAALLAAAETPAWKDELHARTAEAVAAGVFGAPAILIHVEGREPELYWGQDRLELVESALGFPRAEPPPHATRLRSFDLWFDFSSPFAYLGVVRGQALAARTGATLRYRPFLLGGLFRAIGTPDAPLLAMPEVKQRHANADMLRWAKHLGAPMRFPSRFPMNTVKALRVFLQLSPEQQARAALPLCEAYWAQDRDLSDESVLRELLAGLDLDADALLQGATTEAAKTALREATDEAVRLGLCGAPTFVVDGELFWGQDRVPFVEKALDGWKPSV